MIGTVAMAKMTAMLALVSRRKREISAVMRPAGMAMHFLARDAETAGTLPEIVCRTLPKIPSFLLTWKRGRPGGKSRKAVGTAPCNLHGPPLWFFGGASGGLTWAY